MSSRSDSSGLLTQAVTVLAIGVAALELGLGGTVASIVGAGASLAMLSAGAVLETMPSRHQRVLVAVMAGWLFAAANQPIGATALGSSALPIDAFVAWPGVLVALVVIVDKVEATRPGSWMYDSRRRSTWTLAALALAMLAATALDHRPAMRSPALGFLVGAGAVAALAAVVVLDFRELRGIRKACAGVNPRRAPVLDSGIGDETTDHSVERHASYRDSARTTLVIRGSLARAVAALRRAVLFHAMALAVAAGALGLGAWRSVVGYPSPPPSHIFAPCVRRPVAAPAFTGRPSPWIPVP